MGADALTPPRVSFVVPGAPVPKGRPRFSTHGGVVRTRTPKKTESFEALVRMCASVARPAGWPLRCAYSVRIHAVRARRGRGDCSNIAKSIEDGCNTVMWADDEQIVELNVTREEDPESPRTEVHVTALEVACETCGGPTYEPREKRCPECFGKLEAKRASKRRAS